MAKLGSKKRPLILKVQDQSRIGRITEICAENDWHYIIGIEPGKPEDISDLEKLLNPPDRTSTMPKIGRNEPCTCGSGKKFKKCCLA